VAAVSVAEVAVFLIVTGASGMAAPVGSLTRPEIEDVAACPYTLPVNEMQKTKAMYRTSWFRGLLMELPPRCEFSILLSLFEIGVQSGLDEPVHL
jgi:hypothetical protein